MFKKLTVTLFLISSVFALPLQVGETCPNVVEPICANGDGDFDLYEMCNGNENGGTFKVTWIALFASW